MKINKKQIEMLKALPDDAFRRVILAVGAASGFDLSGVNVSGEELRKIRSVLSEMDEDDLGRAAEILRNAKNR